MRRTLLKSKIPRAVVTVADLHYEGSLGLDEDLIEAAERPPDYRRLCPNLRITKSRDSLPRSSFWTAKTGSKADGRAASGLS